VKRRPAILRSFPTFVSESQFPLLELRSPSAGENEPPGIAARCEIRIERRGRCRGRCLERAEQWKVLIRGEQDHVIRRPRNMHFRGIHEWDDPGKSAVIPDAISFVIEPDKLSVEGSGVSDFSLTQ
jgi:hypothetical protein